MTLHWAPLPVRVYFILVWHHCHPRDIENLNSYKLVGIWQVLSTGVFTLFCHDVHGFTEEFLSFVTFVFVSCSHVCLLVVSRLLGLTLRRFAPVCSCHRDSLTRGKLAFEQEAVRVSSSLFSIGCCT